MKTNNKVVREKMRKHVLDCVHDPYGEEYGSFEEAAKRLVEDFIRVADFKYNLYKHPNNVERFSEYMRGLHFGFEYAYHSISEFLNDLGINPNGKKYSDEASLKLYHYLVWVEVSDMYYELKK